MGGGSSGSSSSGKTEIRYASYIEEKHKKFLNKQLSKRIETIGTSPFDNYENIEVDDAFFGTGFLLSSYPSLYDMYGKFMAGLDIEVLYDELFEATVNSPIANNLVAAEGALMDDEIDTNSLPRFQTGMRDINSVMSSSFVIGKSLIEDARTKAISKFSAELKYRLVPLVQERWAKHLDWNKNVVALYAEMLKLYYSLKIDTNSTNYGYAEKAKLWPFTVLEFERAGLGALQGASNTKISGKETPSTMSTVFGGLSMLAGIAGIAGLFSDERLKDIQGSFNSGLNEILRIEPILFRWNKSSGFDTEKINAGFSAQNVMQIIPEAVDVDKSGYFTLDDRPIVAALVNAVKEQQKQIDELKLIIENTKQSN